MSTRHDDGKLGMQGFSYGTGKDSNKKIAARFGGAGSMARFTKSRHLLDLKKKAKSHALNHAKN